MSQWEPTVSELTSLGILNTYIIFLPFCSHALGKILSFWLCQCLSSNSLFRLTQISKSPLNCPHREDKNLLLVTSNEKFALLQFLFNIWGYWNIPSLWNHSSMASLILIILSWSSCNLSDTLSQAIFGLSLFHKCWCCNCLASDSLFSRCELSSWWNSFTLMASSTNQRSDVFEGYSWNTLHCKHLCLTAYWASPF